MTQKIDSKILSLDNIGNGVALELFKQKLQEIMENILDPSTEEKATREIILKFRFKPNGDRTVSHVGVLGAVKLGPTKAFETKAFIGKTPEGEFEAYEHNPKQMTMAFSSFINQPKLAQETAVEIKPKKETNHA